jgi:DNA-binding MarR family transcriptional regulator
VDAALAYRLPDPDDGRKVLVHLSDLGRAHEEALAASSVPTAWPRSCGL